jgi:hypothetical protein
MLAAIYGQAWLWPAYSILADALGFGTFAISRYLLAIGGRGSAVLRQKR